MAHVLGAGAAGRPPPSRPTGRVMMKVVPLADLALDVDAAVVLLDDGVADGQAQPGALADALGREERIEDAGAVLGPDARARVGDADDLGPVLDREPDPELAAPGHGVEGVEDDVDEDLLEPFALGVDGGDGRELEDQADVHGLELVVDEGQDLLDALLEVDALERGLRGAAGEGQEVLDDAGDPVGLGLDLLQDLGVVRVGELLLEHLDVAGDARQGRVDLVGDAGREQPDRGQLLRGQQLLLEPDLLGDVLEDDDRPVGLEGVVEQRGAGDVEDLLPPGGRLQS